MKIDGGPSVMIKLLDILNYSFSHPVHPPVQMVPGEILLQSVSKFSMDPQCSFLLSSSSFVVSSQFYNLFFFTIVNPSIFVGFQAIVDGPDYDDLKYIVRGRKLGSYLSAEDKRQVAQLAGTMAGQQEIVV